MRMAGKISVALLVLSFPSNPAIGNSGDRCTKLSALFRETGVTQARAEIAHPELVLEFPEGSPLPSKMVQQAEHVIHEVDEMLGGVLRPPKKLKLILSNRSEKAAALGANPAKGEMPLIYAPFQLESAGRVKHPIFSRAALAHEYGHILIHETFPDWIPGVYRKIERLKRKTLERLKGIGDETSEYNADLVRKRTLMLSADDPRTKELAALKKALDAAEMKYYEVSIYSSAYQELFADTVAVALEGDGKAIYRTLHRTGTKDPIKTKLANARDFTRKYSVSRWRATQKHVYFSPTRAYLWKHYLSNPEFRRQPQEIVRKLYLAIRREFLDLYSTGKLEKISPSDANRRMIEAIERQFAIVDHPQAAFTR